MKHHWLKSLAPNSLLDTHSSFFEVQGKRADLGLEILPAETTCYLGKRRRRFCAEPGPPCPGCAGPGRSILAPVPAGAGGPRTQARMALCQAPKPLLNSEREAPPPRFPRVPRLPAGQAGALRRRADSRGGGRRGRGAQAGAAIPPAPQTPPPSGRRLSSQVRARGRASFSSGRRTWNLRVPGRAPSCAQVEAAREAPPGRPSRPQSHGLRLPRAGVDAPHLRPVHTCRRLGRHCRGSSPAPPLVRPLLRPPPLPLRRRRRERVGEGRGFPSPKRELGATPPPSG